MPEPAQGEALSPDLMAAIRRSAEVQGALLRSGDDGLWQAHCEQEQDAARAFLRARLMQGRAPLATALGVLTEALSFWSRQVLPKERRFGEQMITSLVAQALKYGREISIHGK